MKSIQWHPDQKIIFRVDDKVICSASLEEASEILGKPLDPLPNGAIGCDHYPEENRFVYYNKKMQLDIKEPWADGLALLEKEAKFIHLNKVHLSKQQYVHGISPIEDMPEGWTEENADTFYL